MKTNTNENQSQNLNSKNKRRIEFLRLAAAASLRTNGFEVYTLPDNGVGYLPHLVAYRSGRFFNVYLFESLDEKRRVFEGGEGRKAFEYAAALNATIITVRLRVTVLY